MPIGICKMCLKEKPLQDSHFMPGALYDYCRKGEHRPIKVGDGILLPTDWQTSDYVLCADCEDILNKGGESWILDKLCTYERSFPLYELLTKTAPLFDEDGMAVYLADRSPHIYAQKIIHFALGIFWKASVHPWKKDRVEPRIELGPYSEDLRSWLLESGPFPQFLYLVMIIERPERAQITINDPYEGKREDWRTHFFHAPGVLFMLALGKTVSEEIRTLAINNQGNPINVSKALTDDFEKLLVESYKRSRQTKSFLKAKAKADAERKGVR